MRKTLTVSVGVLIFLLVGLSVYFFSMFPKGCSTEIISEQDGLTVKISDKDKWQSFISAITICENGEYGVYDQKADRVYPVKNISYIFTDNTDGLITFRNTQTERVFYRWKIEVDQSNNAARVVINLPDLDSEDLDRRLFSSVFSMSRRLFEGPAYREKNLQLAIYTDLESVGLTYEAN